jgi:hypothetical protein
MTYNNERRKGQAFSGENITRNNRHRATIEGRFTASTLCWYCKAVRKGHFVNDIFCCCSCGANLDKPQAEGQKRL